MKTPHKTHRQPQTHKRPRLWCVLCLCLVGAGLLTLTGCEEKPPTAASHPPKSFVVDAPGVLYFYEDIKRGRLAARSLSDIPENRRQAIQIHKSGWPKVENRSLGGYIANLLDAKDGDTLTATWRSRRYIMGAAFAQALADERAFNITFIATEMAVVSPNSRRRQRIKSLRDTLDKMTKPPEKDPNTPAKPKDDGVFRIKLPKKNGKIRPKNTPSPK